MVCTHRQVVFAARAIARRLDYGPRDVVLAALPLSFDYGLYQLLLAAIGGSEVVLADAAAPVRVLTVLREHRVTVMPVVPSLAEMLCRLAARGTPPDHVRLFTNTGAALAGSTIEALRSGFPGAAVVAMYGITECKRVTIAEPDADRERPGSVGLPLDGTTVEVLDERGRTLPPGEVGEIVVGGPHVMTGYWNAPGPTAERYRPDPRTGRTRLHTGDQGRLDADGHLCISGRLDDQFKRRGVRMSTPEIEAAALDVPGVRAAAALPPRDGLDLRLVVTGEDGLSADRVIEGLEQRLEAAKVPAACRVIARMPLTPMARPTGRRWRPMSTDPRPISQVPDEDLLAAELVRRYGSPLYVYDLARAERAAADLRAALPGGPTSTTPSRRTRTPSWSAPCGWPGAARRSAPPVNSPPRWRPVSTAPTASTAARARPPRSCARRWPRGCVPSRSSRPPICAGSAPRPGPSG